MHHTLLAYTSSLPRKHQQRLFTSLLPIGLCSLHAVLRSAGFPATLANLSGVPESSVRKLLLEIKPTVAGLSQWTHNRHETIALAKLIKRTVPDCVVLLGGGHATHQAELILQRHPEIDLIAVGEAETTLTELLDALQRQLPLETVPGLVIRSNGLPSRTPPRKPLTELDTLPFPSSSLQEALFTDISLQAEFISSSRGCPASCSFCASPAFWGRRVRARSAASVADEMLFIRDRYGLIYLSLRDDTFTADRRRTIALCKELIERDLNIFWNCQSRVEAIDSETLGWMRRAGCECVQLGVESGSPDILRQFGKQSTPEKILQASNLIRQVGMHLSIYLITANPRETESDLQKTIGLVKRIRPDDLQIAPLAYYPGTQLFQAALEDGLVQPDLFETNRQEAVLAQADGQKQVDRLLARTIRYLGSSSAEELLAIQKKAGFAPVTAMQAGDRFAAAGDYQKAATQYRLMIQNGPRHPWGWFLLGELHEQTGMTDEAAACYHTVLTLVPHHRPSLEGLERIKQ